MRTYGTEGGSGGAIQQTNDGQYLIAGHGDHGILFIKININGDTVWRKTYTKGVIVSMQPTTEGGYIITGFTSDTINDSSSDIWLVKINDSADMLWTKIYVRSGDDRGNTAQQTIDGGYIIGGRINFNHWDNADGFLIRTDEKGDTVWTKTDTSAFSYTYIQQTADEGYIMSGSYLVEDTTDGSAGESTNRIIKTDPAGDTIWTTYFETGDLGWGSPICITADGGYVFTGRTGEGIYDVWIQKIDNQGTPIWSKTFEGDETAEGNFVQQTDDGGFIILAEIGTYYTGGGDIWLLKTDANGDTLWTKTFGGIEHYKGREVQQTSDGGYIILGYKQLINGKPEILLIKTDANGNVAESSGVKDASDFGIHIYPNPANNLLTIQKDNTEPFSFEITSLNGQLIQSGTYAGQSQQIDISSFQSGVYIINIRSEDHSITQKFTKL